MQKAGVDLDDAAAVASFNSEFFSNRTAAEVAGNFVSGRQQRVKRDEQQKNAKGMEGAETIHTRDVGAALEGVNAQLTNMASSAKLAEASIAGLNGAMGLIQEAGKRLNEPGGWFDEGKKKIESEVRDAKAVGGVIGRVLEWDKNVSGAGRKLLEDGGVGSTRLGTRRPRAEEPAATWPSSADGIPYVDGGPNARYSPAKAPWQFDYGSARLGTQKRFVPPSFLSPGVSDTMTYGTGVGGDKAASTVTVQGTMEDEGKVTIEINPSSSLLEVVRRAEVVMKMAGRINGNGPGSTGRSSPDAEAPSRIGFGGGGL